MQNGIFENIFEKPTSIYLSLEDCSFWDYFISLVIPEFKKGGLFGLTEVNLQQWIGTRKNIQLFLNMLDIDAEKSLNTIN